jgi:MFS family permease
LNTTSPLSILKITEFRNFIIGRFVFNMGLRMMSTLVAYWLYQLTHDAFYIGMIGLAEAIPAISLALYAGFVIDKSEKKKLLLITVMLYAICAFVLLSVSTHWFQDQFGIKLIIVFIYTTIFITGVVRAFAGPSLGAMIGAIVPRDVLKMASQVNSTSYLTSNIVGHAMAGFLIAWVNITGTFIVVVACIVIGWFAFTRLTKKPALLNPERKTLEAVAEGIKYVFSTKEILGAISLDLFAVLFGGAVAMIPVYASAILHVGPIGFGWLNAASDIGSMSMVLSLTILPLQRKQGMKLLLAVGGFGLCIIIFGLSKWYLLSFFALLISGVMDGVSVVIRSNIVQLKTPDELRGRVLSVNSMFIDSSNEIGQFESGLTAKLMGNVVSVVFGGCMTLFVVVTTWIKAPQLRKMEY